MRTFALRAYVGLVVTAAVVLVVVSFIQVTADLTLISLCALMLLAGVLRFNVLPNHPAVLDSVALVAVFVIAGPWHAIAVAVFGYLSPLRQGEPWLKKFFNGGQRILAAAGGALAYGLAGGPTGAEVLDNVPHAVAAALCATVGHQIVNAVLVCIVLGIEGRVPIAKFLRGVVATTFLPMLGYSTLGVLMAVLWVGGLQIGAGLVVAVPLVVARWAMSQYQAEENAQAATMRAFIHVIETKDLYTRGHSERVSQGVSMLGKHLKLPEDRQAALEHAGLLHDVGKVGVPTSVIQKKGKLDDTEWAAIRLHPARGVELIRGIPFLEEVKSAVLHHHEKFDGTGYPAGLSGERIPYFARMIGIVDAFDCLTSTRSYRPAKSVDETLGILIQDRNTHFDPALVDAFVEVIHQHGWTTPEVVQPAPGTAVEAPIDHDDLSLGSGGGATGSAAGPAS